MPVLTNWQQLIDYCHAALAHEKTEQFRILFLDRKNVLIADEVQQRGTIDHTPVYPREVVKRALALERRRADPGAQPSLGRSQAVARRHRDDHARSEGRRGARHRDPRSPGDRPQGPCELQEPGIAGVMITMRTSNERSPSRALRKTCARVRLCWHQRALTSRPRNSDASGPPDCFDPLNSCRRQKRCPGRSRRRRAALRASRGPAGGRARGTAAAASRSARETPG